MTSKKMTSEKIEMSETLSNTTDRQIAIEQWLSIRKEAGLKIDAATAVVDWTYAQTVDPYGVESDLPDVLADWQGIFRPCSWKRDMGCFSRSA